MTKLTKDNHSQQVSGSLASVEETKQSGMACNSADTKDKLFCLEDYKEHDLVNGVRMRVFPETIIKQALAELMRSLNFIFSGDDKINWAVRAIIIKYLKVHFGESLMPEEVKA